MKIISLVLAVFILLGVSINQIETDSVTNFLSSVVSVDPGTNPENISELQNGSGVIQSTPPHILRRFIAGLFFICVIFGTGFFGAGFLMMSMAKYKKGKPTDRVDEFEY